MMKEDTLDADYGKLTERVKDLMILDSVVSLAHWDTETKMPPKGIQLRSNQLAVLGRISHRMSTDREIEKLLSKIERHPDFQTLSDVQKRNVLLTRKHYDEQTKLPEELVVETAKQQALTTDVWKKAKASKDFAIFKPELRKLLELRRKAAEILMDVKMTKTPYDALVDIFEPKMTEEMISKVFEGLKDGLISIMSKCLNSTEQPPTHFLGRSIPLHMQRKISRELVRFIGYDVESPKAGGRIDETEHPFTSGYYDDVRITTHYYKDNMKSSIFSILHEGGHALYEQNLRPEWMYQPVGAGCSLGFHESQSRFVENIVGRSRDFWVFFYPKLRQITRGALSNVELDSFVASINKVHPSKIRVEADEVTYCLHVIIRFEIERDLIAGNIAVDDLPEIWNHMYKDYLGLQILDDSEGLMQDIHWASGLFGYFPTYALGNIYSGQILAAMESEKPNWRAEIACGNLQELTKWLIDNIHSRGNLHDPADLIRRVTGDSVNVKPYLEYLDEKYSEIYGY